MEDKKSSRLFDVMIAGLVAVEIMTIAGTLGEWLGFLVILLFAVWEARRSKGKALLALGSWIVSAIVWDAVLYSVSPQYGHVIFWFLK